MYLAPSVRRLSTRTRVQLPYLVPGTTRAVGALNTPTLRVSHLSMHNHHNPRHHCRHHLHLHPIVIKSLFSHSQSGLALDLDASSGNDVYVYDDDYVYDPSSISVCHRISSVEAASLIRKAYYTTSSTDMQTPTCNDDMDAHLEGEGLVIITSDASRGANRLTGLASIIREIPPCRHDDCSKNDNNNIQDMTAETLARNSNHDRIVVATRRTHSTDAKDIVKSEVAAVALGVRAALKHIPMQRRKRVLLLTDSSSAMDYFCGRCHDGTGDGHGNGNGHGTSSVAKNGPTTTHISSSHANDPHYKAIQTLIRDALHVHEVEEVKDKGGGRRRDDLEQKQMLVQMAKVKSNKEETDGFFDHDVTDIVSSFVKNVPNKNACKMYIPQQEDDRDRDRETRNNTLQDDDPTSRRMMSPSLQMGDLEYLSRSEERVEQNGVRKPQVILKKERGWRLERCKLRMSDELGIHLVK